jgi:hypothetical protein
MSTISFTRVLTLSILVCTFSIVAQAQATRTWVSGVGDDLNPCSRTAPCKTFAGAISKTTANGEINCLDPGGYGAVTITKSLTIDCEDTQGSILASSVNGVIVSMAAADTFKTVRLRGLSINGAGTTLGLSGVSVTNTNNVAVKVFIEELIIQNFSNTGILFAANGGNLVVNDSEIISVGSNVSPFTQSGIRVDSAGATRVDVTIDNTHCDMNLQGIRFEDNVAGHIRNSTASNNTLNGFVVNPSTTSSAMTIDNSSANSNDQFGLFAGGTGGAIGTARITGVTLIDNTTNQISISAPGVVCTNTKNHIGTPTNAPAACFNDQ